MNNYNNIILEKDTIINNQQEELNQMKTYIQNMNQWSNMQQGNMQQGNKKKVNVKQKPKVKQEL